jgi:hypothetical protein
MWLSSGTFYGLFVYISEYMYKMHIRNVKKYDYKNAAYSSLFLFHIVYYYVFTALLFDIGFSRLIDKFDACLCVCVVNVVLIHCMCLHSLGSVL